MDAKTRTENTVISETVIYMKDDGRRVPAIICGVLDATGLVVDLWLPVSNELVTGVPFSSTDEVGRWWRRIKF